MKINSTFKPRQIKPENICIGDTIRWTTKKNDLTVSKMGKLHSREYFRHMIIYYTEQDEELGVVYSDRLYKNTVTLLQPAPQNTDIPLQSFNELMDLAEGEKS